MLSASGVPPIAPPGARVDSSPLRPCPRRSARLGGPQGLLGAPTAPKDRHWRQEMRGSEGQPHIETQLYGFEAQPPPALPCECVCVCVYVCVCVFFFAILRVLSQWPAGPRSAPESTCTRDQLSGPTAAAKRIGHLRRGDCIQSHNIPGGQRIHGRRALHAWTLSDVMRLCFASWFAGLMC